MKGVVFTEFFEFVEEGVGVVPINKEKLLKEFMGLL